MNVRTRDDDRGLVSFIGRPKDAACCGVTCCVGGGSKIKACEHFRKVCLNMHGASSGSSPEKISFVYRLCVSYAVKKKSSLWLGTRTTSYIILDCNRNHSTIIFVNPPKFLEVDLPTHDQSSFKEGVGRSDGDESMVPRDTRSDTAVAHHFSTPRASSAVKLGERPET